MRVDVAGWVLGCHRSGTSLLSSTLRSLAAEHGGPSLGPDVVDDVVYPTGLHESAALVGVNTQLLTWAGCTWHRPFVARPAWEDPASIALIARLRERLHEHAHSVGWIDKDPRLCLTRDALSHLLLKDLPSIAVIRNPISVATSLYRRDGFSLRKGAAIWMLYNLHLFNARSRPPDHIILFDELVSPDEQIKMRVAGILASFVRVTSGGIIENPGSTEREAVEQLNKVRRQYLVRSEDRWHVDEDSSLARLLDDIWLGCRAMAHEDERQRVASLMRDAWATLSPILEPEVALPLHELHARHGSQRPGLGLARISERWACRHGRRARG